MKVTCPFCQQVSEVAIELAEGQHVKCAYCSQKFSYHEPQKKSQPLPDFKEGQTVGAYKIVRCVGRGGMGAVYEVEHITLGAHFAMKVFTAQADNGHNDILKQKFLEEAKQLSAIKHANIAHVFDLSVDNATGAPYFIMDLITYAGGEPCTLDDLDHSQLEEDLIFLWFSEMCKVLDHVHSLGVIHRDIKLENILLNQEQHVILTDFGVAKVFEGLAMNAVQNGCKTNGTSDEGLIFGTPHYMAPEVNRGETVTAAADVYSLGVAFFRLLTGEWYDERPEALKTLTRRKYDWMPVLSEMLAPVEKRPTKLFKFPIKLSSRVTTKFRQAGTWKLVLAENKQKSKLYREIEKARRLQELRERKKQKIKRILVISVIAEVALFAGLFYQFANSNRDEVKEENEYGRIIDEKYTELNDRWLEIQSSYKDFLQELKPLDPAMTSIEQSLGRVDYHNKIQCKELLRRIKEANSRLDDFIRNCNAWPELYYLSAQCSHGLDVAKGNPAFAKYARQETEDAGRFFDVGNKHSLHYEYHKAKLAYEQSLMLLKNAKDKVRYYQGLQSPAK